MLNYATADWTAVPPVDKDCAACIQGPNPAAPASERNKPFEKALPLR
jgi:hypothetical protein